MDSLNYISVAESASRKITATGARLLVRISGQSFFTGAEAIEKAAEVSECVSGLKACGIPKENIRIKNVKTHVESGFLSKSSSATYDLEVSCDSMDLLGPAVATIASLKNSELISIGWNYSEIEKIRGELLQDAVRLANSSANAIASALNTSLAGVHRLRYEITGLDDKPARLGIAASKMGRSRIAAGDFDEVVAGLSLSHTADIVAHVNADFLVNTG